MATAFSSGLSSALSGGADTVVARASAAGPGALAVVRLSGRAVAPVCARLCPDLDCQRSWSAQLVVLYGGDGEVLDRAVAIPYRAPRSYTGEDMVELVLHGSSALVEAVLGVCVAAGARLAAPGEFTRRAVANGKMDLLQAEAVADLIAADTAWQLRLARAQLEGALSAEVEALRGEVLALAAELEAVLDFPTHQVAVTAADLADGRDRVLAGFDRLLATSGAGEVVRHGLRVVLAGPPNAGKSTLFNTLLGRERAIVSSRPGTTRDVLTAELELEGLRLVLVDTAGLGASGDVLEAEGVRRARAAVAEADGLILLWPADGDEPVEPAAELPRVKVRSKWDLAPPGARPEPGWIALSAVRGDGVDELHGALAEMVGTEVRDLGGEVAVGRRHRAALEGAREAVVGLDLDQPELAAEALRWALAGLAELLGEVADEDVLDQVFARFCIGK
jgi:tRNA modification GTPase